MHSMGSGSNPASFLALLTARHTAISWRRTGA